VRVDDLIKHSVHDRTGRYLGRVVDIVTERDPAGVPRVVGVVVGRGWHGRLLGYERPGVHRPWLLERVAKLLVRDTRTVSWDEVRIS
jgi:sporulation protein YlmC with PRC-barrel domain